MLKNQKQQKNKQLGAGIDWSDQELANLAAISQADLSIAASVWRNAAPKSLQGLVDAGVEKEQDNNEQ